MTLSEGLTRWRSLLEVCSVSFSSFLCLVFFHDGKTEISTSVRAYCSQRTHNAHQIFLCQTQTSSVLNVGFDKLCMAKLAEPSLLDKNHVQWFSLVCSLVRESYLSTLADLYKPQPVHTKGGNDKEGH